MDMYMRTTYSLNQNIENNAITAQHEFEQILDKLHRTAGKKAQTGAAKSGG